LNSQFGETDYFTRMKAAVLTLLHFLTSKIGPAPRMNALKRDHGCERTNYSQCRRRSHFLLVLLKKCVETFMSKAGHLRSNNWKFTFFNYSAHQIEVIVTYQKPMFEVKCTDCGNTATVPFKPTPGKPVYCRTCFSKHMTNRPESASRNNDSFTPKQAWARRRDNGQAKKEEAPISIFHRR